MGLRFLGLTTGPFRVPSKVSGDPVGGNPIAVRLEVMNPTNRDLEAEFFADFGTEPNSPLTHVNPSGVITFPANSLTALQVPVTFLPGQVVRVSMIGDIKTNGQLLEVEVVGLRLSDNMNEPTMFFRHNDLFPTNNITNPTLDACVSRNRQWVL